jgi:hypothetical protein
MSELNLNPFEKNKIVQNYYNYLMRQTDMIEKMKAMNWKELREWSKDFNIYDLNEKIVLFYNENEN